MWGITLDQMRELADDPRHEEGMTVREVVEQIVKPDTAGSGVGYALLKNAARPLKASVLVSHAWDAKYSDLLVALSASGEDGPFWVCAMALYQPEDIPAFSLERQLGLEAGGPLAAVLRCADALLCVLTPSCNIFSRLWCLFEVFTAVQLGREVRIASKKPRFGLGAIDEFLIKLCEEPVDSKSAQCGRRADEMAIRWAIQACPGGHATFDNTVENVRLAALVKNRDQLVGGGWKDTEIGRQYQDAIHEIEGRLRRRAPPGEYGAAARAASAAGLARRSRHSDSAMGDAVSPRARWTVAGAVQQHGGSGGGSLAASPKEGPEEATTPMASTRQHWAPTVSM